MEIICDGNMKKEKLLRGNGNGSKGGKKRLGSQQICFFFGFKSDCDTPSITIKVNSHCEFKSATPSQQLTSLLNSVYFFSFFKRFTLVLRLLFLRSIYGSTLLDCISFSSLLTIQMMIERSFT